MDQNHSLRFRVRCLAKAKRCYFGFTFIEIMVVIAIIGTLSAIAIPNYISYRNRGFIAETIAEISTIEIDIREYVLENGELPDSLDDVGLGDLKDPWGNPYQYLRIDGGGVKGKGKLRKDRNLVPVNSDYDLYSKGRDGESVSPFTAKASQDDIVRANDGDFVGLVSDY